MTTIFGNPGSTELPFFREFPDDFRYVLGLQESVVVGMADGYAQATRNAALVNLHSAAGVGHAMGNIFTAYRNRTPLVITAGQQARSILPYEPFLFATQAAKLPEPVREVEQRARPRRGRAGRDRSRVSHRDAGAVRTDVRLDSRGRLGSHLGTDRHAHGQPLDASRSGSHRHDCRAARSQRAAGVRRRSRRRSQRRVGSGRRARRAASGAGVGQPDVIALQLSRAASAVCRFPAGDPRADRQVPRRSRSHRRPRRAGLHVSHRGLRTAHPAGIRADSDDRRWRRRRVDAGRHGHRVQRAAWRRGAARALASACASNAERTQQRAAAR